MESIWQLQVAKNRLSEVVDAAVMHGAQIITRHGKPIVKVVSLSVVEQQSSRAAPSLEAWLLNAPRGNSLEQMPRRSSKKPLDLAA